MENKEQKIKMLFTVIDNKTKSSGSFWQNMDGI